MAIYNLEVRLIKRSEGRSATAAAAYRAALKIEDRRTGEVHDYSKKRGVVHREIILPQSAPNWMADREQLWNAVELVETRKDAQLSREVQLALPHELTDAQRLELVKGFIAEAFTAQGMVADLCIHKPDSRSDNRNFHAHILLTLRNLLGEGFGPKNRDWNQKPVLEGWREVWSQHVNFALERAGLEVRVDHRSYKDQGLDLEPEPKMGPDATQMERKGIQTRVGDERRRIKEENETRKEVSELRKQARQLKEEERELQRRIQQEEASKRKQVRMNSELVQQDLAQLWQVQPSPEPWLERLNRQGYRVVLDDRKNPVILDPTGGRHQPEPLKPEEQHQLADILQQREPLKASAEQLNPLWREHLHERLTLRAEQQIEKLDLQETLYLERQLRQADLRENHQAQWQAWREEASELLEKRQAQGSLGRMLGKASASQQAQALQEARHELKATQQQERQALQRQLKARQEHAMRQLETQQRLQARTLDRQQERETLEARRQQRQGIPPEAIRNDWLKRQEHERKPSEPLQPIHHRETVQRDLAHLWQRSQTPEAFRQALEARGYQLAETTQGRPVIVDPTGKPHLFKAGQIPLPPELMPHLQGGKRLGELESRQADPTRQQQFAERAALLQAQMEAQQRLRQEQEEKAEKARKELAAAQAEATQRSDERLAWGTARLGQIGYIREGWSSLSSWTRAEHQLVQQEAKEARQERQQLEADQPQQRERLEQSLQRSDQLAERKQEFQQARDWEQLDRQQELERHAQQQRERDTDRAQKAREQDQERDPAKTDRGREPGQPQGKDIQAERTAEQAAKEEEDRRRKRKDLGWER